MKRVLSIGLVLALVSVACIAADVPSVNVAGFVRKSLAANELTMMGVNLDGIGQAQTMQSLFGDDAVGAGNYNSADWFIVWDKGAQQFQRFAMYDGDGEFYPCNTLAEWESSSPTNPALAVGSAVFVRCNPGGANEFSLTGQAVMDPDMTIPIVAGLQAVSYPLSSEVTVQGMDFVNDGATAAGNYNSADWIITWEGSYYQRYALYDGDSTWYGANSLAEWEAGTVLGSDRTVKVGEGFWYKAQSGLTWTEDNQYLSNL